MTKQEQQRMLDVEGWLQYMEASGRDNSEKFNEMLTEYKKLLAKYFKR
jgi:hypothetical protein